MQELHSRRDFIQLSLLGFGAAVFSSGVSAQSTALSKYVHFAHGVASGDPLHDRVILWTRVTPENPHMASVTIAWEVALDPEFLQLVNSGSTETSKARDYTVKIDAAGLLPGRRYYYRFLSAGRSSPVGLTRTLPDHHASEINLAVVSCSNYAAGRFHVYREVAQRQDLAAVLHLGDYIYEYGRGEYASENAALLGREVLPEREIIDLSAYRQRYAQYRSDPDLQAAHQQHPFLVVWDDHEIANDTWREGAENHQSEEGDFKARKLAALQAYAEWMPLRPLTDDNKDRIYRSFQFGRLVTLHLLDTRVLARDKSLEILGYFSAAGFDAPRFFEDLKQDDRTMLGAEQRNWLIQSLRDSSSVWQVLGQQVLMSRLYLAGALATQRISLSGFSRLVQLATLEAQGQELSADDQSFLDSQRTLLKIPALPINLDAWDGYPRERETILNAAREAGKNLVVLAGDSHNAWASQLKNENQEVCGVEFAAPSVTSPGLEKILNLSPESIAPTEQQLLAQIKGLTYTNVSDRGYLALRFTEAEARAEFIFVDSILGDSYRLLRERGTVLMAETETLRLSRPST